MIKKEIKFLLKHSSIYGIGTVVGQAVGFLLLPIYTRYLTPLDYGVMALVNSTMGIIGIVVGLGINNGMSRFYFDFEDETKHKLVVSTTYLICIFVIVLIWPVLYYLSAVLSELIFRTQNFRSLFVVSSSALLLEMIVNVCLDYMRILTASIKYVVITLLRMIFVISLNIFFVVFKKMGVIGIFYSSLISAVTFSLFLSVDLLSKVGVKFSISLASNMIKYSFPLVFSEIFRVIVNESDKYFINYFFSPLETGIFSLAQKIGTSIHMLITSPFLQVYIPRRFEIMKKRDAKSTYASVSFYYLFVLCTVGLTLAISAPEIVRLMTTTRYFSAAKYIPFVVSSMIIFGMRYHFQIGIMIHKRTRIIAYVNGLSCTVNIILNWLLIRSYGIWGAIITINAAYGVTTLLYYYSSQRIYPISYDLKKMGKLLAVCIFIYWVSTNIVLEKIVMSLVIKAGLIGIYLSLLFVLNVIDKKEIQVIRDYAFRKAYSS